VRQTTPKPTTTTTAVAATSVPLPKPQAQRFAPRNRTRVVPTRSTTIKPRTTELITTTTTPFRTTTELTTRVPTTRVVRRKIARPVTTRKPETTTTTTEIPISNETLDDEIASILPALTSVKPRKQPIDTSTRAVSIVANNIETSSIKVNPTTTSIDEIIEHQNKIKGIITDYDENNEKDEKLIGVMGSQVMLIINLHLLKINISIFFPG
jgi:hypothetical protein